MVGCQHKKQQVVASAAAQIICSLVADAVPLARCVQRIMFASAGRSLLLRQRPEIAVAVARRVVGVGGSGGSGGGGSPLLSARNFSVVERVFDPQRTYTRPRTYLRVETLYMRNQPGQLLNLLAQFSDNKVNLTSIESKLNTFALDSPIFHIDVEGEPDSPAIVRTVNRLREIGARADIMPARPVPWFPVNIRDLDLTRETLDAEVRFGFTACVCVRAGVRARVFA
jgi:hypothetical protein